MLTELNHSIRLYFPYTFDSTVPPDSFSRFSDKLCNLSIEQLVKSADFISPANTKDSPKNSGNVHPQFAQSNVWERSECKLDNRIHKFASKLINGVDNTALNNGFFGMPPLKLSNDALRVLNQGSPNDLGKGIAIALKPSGVERLAKDNISALIGDNSWPMMFDDIWFYALNTGIAMMVVEISLKQPGKNPLKISHLNELQEINYLICRNGNDKQSALITWGIDNVGKQVTSLGLSQLVEDLIPVNLTRFINLKATDDRKNIYSYTYIATNNVLDYEQRKTYIFRMARKYNSLYLPEKMHEHIEYFEPFRPITHAFSLEGSVSYIDYTAYGDNLPESIKNFGITAINAAYAPMILLTYAEYIFLREVANNSNDENRVDMRNPTNKNLQKLREFRTKLYDFRLNFRFTQISGNSNHNLYCNANKKALEIEKLLSETSNDVQEIEQYISDFVRQKQETRLKRLGVLGSLFAAIISWVELWGISLNQIIFDRGPLESSSITIFLIVLVLLGGAVLYTSRNSSDE